MPILDWASLEIEEPKKSKYDWSSIEPPKLDWTSLEVKPEVTPTQEFWRALGEELLTNIKKYPGEFLKTAITPVTKTFDISPTEKLREVSDEKMKQETSSFMAGLKELGVGLAETGENIIAAPATWIPLPIGKILGKLPIKGIPLETWATTPMGKNFLQHVSEKRIMELFPKATEKEITYAKQLAENIVKPQEEKIIKPSVSGEARPEIKTYTGGEMPTASEIAKERVSISPQLKTQKEIVGEVKPKVTPEPPYIPEVVKPPVPTKIPKPVTPATEVLTPVQEITQALKVATPKRAEQESLYSQERAKRFGAVRAIGQRLEGEQGYYKKLGALKGPLPKVQFEGIRDKISQNSINELFRTIDKNSILLEGEKVSAQTGLIKLLGAKGGAVPTEGEIKLLSEIFPPEFIQTILSKRPVMTQLFEGAGAVLNLPRAVMASVDLSAPLRQGIVFTSRPKQWGPAFGNMFKYAFNEKAYQGLMQDIQKRPTYALMRESKLPLTDIGSRLSGREERFMSNLAEKIPIAGHVFRGSNRAYTGFLNKLRADVFDDLVKSAQKQGIKVEGKVLNNISEFVGRGTGRGKMPGDLERSAIALNGILFSPRLMMSRLGLLNPVYYVKLDPFTRKEALKSLFTTAGIAGTVLGLAKLGGADVGVDWRNADFGKIKLENTRYDILGGFQQYIRAAGQLQSGEHISSTTGVKTTVGEGYKPLTRLEIAGRFVETKESPVASFVTLLLKGQTFGGEKIDIPKEVAQRFIPMVIQDMDDLYKEKGVEGVGMGIPAIFGVGVQTYAPTAKEMVYSAGSVEKNVKELRKQGKYKEALELQTKNKEIMRIGRALEPTQKMINAQEKLKTDTERNIRLSPEEKTRRIAMYDKRIKELQKRIEERYKILKSQGR